MPRKANDQHLSVDQSLVPIARDGSLPLSFAQEHLWFLEQRQPKSPISHNSIALRIEGDLNVRRLHHCLITLAQRHEALHTTISDCNGHLTLKINTPVTLPLVVIDMSLLTTTEHQTFLEHIATPTFDVVQGPLLHVRLLRLSTQAHMLVVTLHSIISDGRSMEVFVEELTHLYLATVSGQSAALPPLPVQFADFAYWQRQWLQDGLFESQMHYWRQCLADLPVLQMPTDYPRPLVLSSRGATARWNMPEGLVSSLMTLHQSTESSLFVILLAALQALLMRYSGQSDIAVGSPIDGRYQAETTRLIGFFVNTLVFRTDLSANPSFVETVQQVRDVTLGAYAHKDVPFERLVQEIQPHRNGHNHPLVQVLLVLQNTSLGPIKSNHLTFIPVPIEMTTTTYDLQLIFEETRTGLDLILVYRTDLFMEPTIQRFLGHLQTLLETVSRQPEQPIGTIGLLSATERQHLLVDWNTTTTALGAPDCLHKVFMNQAALTPDSYAVQHEDQRLSYAELDRRTNQLAHLLQSYGVHANVPVVLYVERSIDFIVGLLGIMKAGGAYVPLDTQMPSTRLALVLKTVQSPILLTQRHLAPPAINEPPTVLCLDALDDMLLQLSPRAPVQHTQPSDLAYVLFTSGSTGVPKGVAVEHRQVLAYTRAVIHQLDLPPMGQYALISTLAADLGNTMIFPALTNGSCIHIISAHRMMDPQALMTYFQQHPIDCLKIVPFHLEALLLASHPATILPRQRLIFGGDILSWNLVRQIQALDPPCRLFNHYGPTETTVGVSTYAIDRADPSADLTTTVPLGHPLASTHSYVLDTYGQLTLLGVPGELYIGGATVARGYLHRPDLTAERFVPDPFSGQVGERLYRTGDMVRHTPNGHLAFLGRLDQQIKLRGFRIELGEIEAILQTHPAVRAAVVLLDQDTSHTAQIVAYIVADQQVDASLLASNNAQDDAIFAELQTFLADQLPSYMVPSAWVLLNSFPLTATGKIDRQVLATHMIHLAETATTTYVAPRNELESAIATMCATFLGLQQFGIYDHFFTHGGHSILATRLLAWVRMTFNVEVPLVAFFENPTVATLSALIEQTPAATAPMMAIPRAPRNQHLPVSFAQERVLLVQQLEPDENLAYNYQARLRFIGDLNIAALKQSLMELTERHEILRTTFHQQDDVFVQCVHAACPISMPLFDMQHYPLAQREDEAYKIIYSEIAQSFDVSRLPLLRWLLFRIDPQEHLLIHIEHHLIHDGWSFGVFLRELGDFYNGFATNTPVTLPELPIQFADFAYWQRQWLTSPAATQQLEYWRRTLADAPPLLEITTDRPRPLQNRYRGRQKRRVIDPDLFQALTHLRQQEGTSLFVVMFTTFLIIMHRYSRQDDICLGTSIANRRLHESEGVIGMILNNLVLRNRIADCETWQTLIQRVHEVAIAAYAHQDLPFDKIVEVLQPPRSLGYNPIYQIMFNINDTPFPDLHFVDLTVDLYRILHNGSSKFDMNVTLLPRSEGIELVWEYNIDLYDTETIDRMFAQYLRLLQQMTTTPFQSVGATSLLDSAEQRQILVEWNQLPAPDTTSMCVHQVITQQVTLTPDRVAVCNGHNYLSYQMLEHQTNQLAHYLQHLGVHAEARVVVALPRTTNFVVAILAVLKAGGVYVPIDTSLPSERLIWLLRDIHPRVLLTQHQLISNTLLEQLDIRYVDVELDDMMTFPITPLSTDISPNQLAYLMYTSGSTGAPKGVMISHRGLMNYLQWAVQTYPVAAGRRVPMHSPVTFDLTVTSLFAPLMVGGVIDILPDDDPITVLHTALTQQPQYAFIKLTPAHLDILAAEPDTAAIVNATDTLVVGGEALTSSHVAIWQHHAPQTNIFNEYGPTETTVGCCVYNIPPATREEHSVPIGRPIVNTQLYILDHQLSPTPIRVPGELYVGGSGVARGYWGDPAGTATRFVPHPFHPEPGHRLYRTGDIARYHSDGILDYLGRCDRQIKLRGYRIELGEIEAHLRDHQDISAAVVVLRTDKPRNQHLVAYIVSLVPTATRSNQEFQQQLQAWLSQRLPHYMIPSIYVTLTQLPLTAHGKINYRALPTPDILQLSQETPHLAPRTTVEQHIAAIWSTVLNIEPIGVHDNFFDLGGHSLLATRIIADIRHLFQVTLSLRHFFADATIAHLAELVTAHKNGAERTAAPLDLPTIIADSAERYQTFPLTDVQQAYWVGRVSSIELGNVATHSYREFAVVDLDVDRLTHAWQHLIARHDALRTIVLSHGEQQVLQQVPPYHIQTHDLRNSLPTIRQDMLDARRTDLSHQTRATDTWPLFDIQVSILDQHTAVVHYSFDALICDAWSRRILFRELTQLYYDPTVQLPPLEVTFRDYVLTEIAVKHTNLYQRAWGYWQDRIATLPPAPALPLAQAPALIAHPRFIRYSSILEPQVWHQLKAHAAHLRLTASGVVLAAFAEILAIWSTAPQFTVNLTLFNRLPLHPHINDIVGDFTSLTLLEIDFTSPDSFVNHARRVQQQLWHDLDHRYVSGVQVLRELSRVQERNLRALMPVVFTSTLTLPQAHPAPDHPLLLRDEIFAISQTPQVWLDHQVSEHDGALVLNWDAVDGLFPPGMIDAMFEAYTGLLQRLATDHQLWSTSAYHMVCNQLPTDTMLLNATEAPWTNDRLHSGFLRQVHLQPDQVALIAPEQSLSYAQLYQCAEYIASWLHEQGIGPNMLVAVVMEKGWEQISAVIGILLAGAAYVPIDAELPEQRRAYLLEHSAATIVLTQSWLHDTLAWPVHLQRIAVDQLPVQGHPYRMPHQSTQPVTDLAYVIYTSGSMGLPKGVMIDHRGAVNTIADLNQRYAVTSHDRVLALSSLSFDLSVYDVFGTLAAGGTIIIPTSDAFHDPAYLATLIDQTRITIWNSVPTLMSLLVEYLQERQAQLPESLRLVYLSGDWIPVHLPRQIQDLGTHVQVVSMGGATEASIWSIIYPIDTVDPTWQSIPYGRPMQNQQVYVLNKDLEPCPTWVSGTIYIGGVGLAQGYWRDPQQTATSFVHHGVSGERLYRTGDLGRYLPDGNIEFLGREDFQIKLRGYRIELGEIEAALAACDGVQQAVVVVVGDHDAAKRLIAYVVTHHGHAQTPHQLRHDLQAKLPTYMIPATIIFLEAFPLTFNGKIDRQALSRRPHAPEDTTSIPSAQQQGFITQIVHLIRSVLKQDHITPDADLLEMGANSIDIIRIINQCEQRFGVRPAIRDMYNTPTVQGIANLLMLLMKTAPPDQEEDMAGLSSAVEALDPQAYQHFKQQQHGRRQDIEQRPCISLAQTTPVEDLHTQFSRRSSIRQYALQPIAAQAFGDFLSCLRQIELNNRPKYLYASAGGLYPVQTYLFIKPGRITEIAAGAYYYDPIHHQLVRLSDTTTFDREAFEPTHTRPIWDEAAFGIFFATQLDAITPIYRRKSLHYSTIEIGLMSQLLDLSAPQHRIGLCHIGGTDFQSIQHLFVPQPSHVFLYTIVGGHLEPTHDTSQTTPAEHTAVERMIERVQQLSSEEVQALLIAQQSIGTYGEEEV